MCKVGILALQGDFHAHGRVFDRLGVPWQKVTGPKAMEGLGGLVIPGGESTTLLKLLTPDLEERIRAFATGGGAIYGTCAGAILLARRVLNPVQPSLGVMDIEIVRNGYGRQNESFVARQGDQEAAGVRVPSEMVFIRAPIISKTGPKVRILVRVQGLPVYVQEGNLMATTFHPELSADPSVHLRFLDLMTSKGTISRGPRTGLSAASP